MKVVAFVESLTEDAELASIGPSSDFLATSLKKHSLDVAELPAWSSAARDAIQRSDAVVVGKIIEGGMSFLRSFGLAVI